MIKEMSCIVCPMGCALSVECDENGFLSVSGNTCKRGEDYARSEITNPTRTLTSTVKTVDGRYVPVKSASPLPKGGLFGCMDILRQTVTNVPVAVGDVIVKNIGGTGVDIVATRCIC